MPKVNSGFPWLCRSCTDLTKHWQITKISQSVGSRSVLFDLSTFWFWEPGGGKSPKRVATASPLPPTGLLLLWAQTWLERIGRQNENTAIQAPGQLWAEGRLVHSSFEGIPSSSQWRTGCGFPRCYWAVQLWQQAYCPDFLFRALWFHDVDRLWKTSGKTLQVEPAEEPGFQLIVQVAACPCKKLIFNLFMDQ